MSGGKRMGGRGVAARRVSGGEDLVEKRSIVIQKGRVGRGGEGGECLG